MISGHSPKLSWPGTVAAVGFMAVISAASSLPGMRLLLFPELAALSYDVLASPEGRWASSPGMLLATPVLTSMAGILIAHAIPFGWLSLALAIAVSIAIVRGLKSPVGPAISAGVLPTVATIGTPTYPVCVALGLGALVLTWFGLGRLGRGRQGVESAKEGSAAHARVTFRHPRAWVPAYGVFVALVYMIAASIGVRAMMFPPLFVIAYEMLAHDNGGPWADRSHTLLLACALTAACGFASYAILGGGVLSSTMAMAAGIGAQRALRLHAPPALAIGLLPQ